MKLYHHLLWSTAAAALIAPRRPRLTAVAWAASLVVDLDHLLWFCLSRRTADLGAAVRYFAAPLAGAGWSDATLVLHHPAAPLALFALGRSGTGRLPRLATAIGAGIAFHQGLDLVGDLARHAGRQLRRRRRERLKSRVKQRDDFTCQQCGWRGEPLEVHHRVQPADGGRDEVGNMITLCPQCHDRAHGRPPRPRRSPGHP